MGQGHILRQLAGRHASPVHQIPPRHLELQVGPDAPATLALQGPMEARAQRAQQASTNLGKAMVVARTAARASTGGTLQDKQLKHRARPAARASTGWAQEHTVKHRVRTVPRTRPRLLRAVLESPAHATQATVAMPAQEHAQLA